MVDRTRIAEELDARFTRVELNARAAQEYGIEDPVGFGRKGELIEAMIQASPTQAALDAGVDPESSLDGAESGPEPDPEDNTPDEDETTPEDEASDADELQEGIVLVVGNGPSNRVALWERHADHPGGELFLRGGDRAEAAYTWKVRRAEKRGKLRVVDGK